MTCLFCFSTLSLMTCLFFSATCHSWLLYFVSATCHSVISSHTTPKSCQKKTSSQVNNWSDNTDESWRHEAQYAYFRQHSSASGIYWLIPFPFTDVYHLFTSSNFSHSFSTCLVVCEGDPCLCCLALLVFSFHNQTTAGIVVTVAKLLFCMLG